MTLEKNLEEIRQELLPFLAVVNAEVKSVIEQLFSLIRKHQASNENLQQENIAVKNELAIACAEKDSILNTLRDLLARSEKGNEQKAGPKAPKVRTEKSEQSSLGIKAEGKALPLYDDWCFRLHVAKAESNEAYHKLRDEMILHAQNNQDKQPQKSLSSIMSRARHAPFVARVLRSCHSPEEMQNTLENLCKVYENSKEEILQQAERSLQPRKRNGYSRGRLKVLVVKNSRANARAKKSKRVTSKNAPAEPAKAKEPVKSESAKAKHNAKPKAGKKRHALLDTRLNDYVRYDLICAKHLNPETYSQVREECYERLGIKTRPGRGGIINTLLHGAINPRFRINFAARYLSMMDSIEDRREALSNLAKIYGMKTAELGSAVSNS